MEAKIHAKGLNIPERKLGVGKAEPAVRSGNLVYTSGHTSGNHLGKVGKEFTKEQAFDGARDCALSCLGAIKAVIGDLDKITRIVKIIGFVNCAEGFSDTSSVIHGCTDLLHEIFGEKGRHARSAIGVYQLPANSAVEIEMIVEVKD
ncbi:MAG: RidA family protein [Verrucomicrobiae bacterium]|nr:RidA family protein [Verrucomicrobiae bacterium]